MYFYEASSICFLLLEFFQAAWTHISIFGLKSTVHVLRNTEKQIQKDNLYDQ